MMFTNVLFQFVLFAPSCVSAFTAHGYHPLSFPVASNSLVTSSLSGREEGGSSGKSRTRLWMDFDSMSMSELERLSHQKGYDTKGKDRVELIMICKGHPELVNASPLSSVVPSAPIRNIGRHEDYDVMSEHQLQQIANQMGFSTYQTTRTDLVMIAKGYGDRIGAKRLDENTWQSEIAARSFSGNGLHVSGSSPIPPPPATGNTEFVWKPHQGPPKWSPESPATDHPFQVSINGAATNSAVTNGVPTTRAAIAAATAPMNASTPNPSTNGMSYSAGSPPMTTDDKVGIISEEVELPQSSAIQQYYDFLAKLNSLHIPNIKQLVSEYDACNPQEKAKVKKAIMDLYEWELNMHSERLADLNNMIHHMTKPASPTSPRNNNPNERRNDHTWY